VNPNSQKICQEAAQLLRARQYSAAETLLRKLIAKSPNEGPAHKLLAHSLMRQEKVQESIHAFSAAISCDPNSADAHGDIGRAYLHAKQNDEALQHFRQAVSLDSAFSEVWMLLGNTLMNNGDYAEGRAALIQAEKTDPHRALIENANRLLANKQMADAEKQCLALLDRVKIHPGAIVIMARLAVMKKAWVRAETMLKKGLQYTPYHVGLWHQLAEVSEALSKHQQQLDSLERCILIAPESAFLLALIGKVYTNLGRYEPALQAFDRSLQIEENNPEYLMQRGYAYRFMGERAGCEADFNRCKSIKHYSGGAYWALADLKDYPFDEADVSDMSAIFSQPSESPHQRSMAGFALAKCLEARGETKQAFDYYQGANALRPGVNFSPDDFDRHNRVSRELYSAKMLTEVQCAEVSSGPTPIFVVGLPRSGSTLVEQVLASHSAIEGTIELTNLPRVAVALEEDSHAKGMSVGQYLRQLSPSERAAYGRQYLDETAIFRTGSDFFVDKRPGNFRLAGLIHLLLPHAKIIDVRRHPLATGWGLYKQHFASGFDFSYHLDHIGRYYRSYLQMMDHWDAALPGKIFCQHYEALVEDTQSSVRSLLSYLGLDYEQSCLDFHNNPRSVQTASSEQVRQPIYRTGLKSWLPFDEQLAPLKAALGEEVLNRWA